ncbi:uncharacterized protein LOC106413574 [Brassica napus]|uniref:uncharacterized protein LOC106413574 n=1 Tax=Brassica napus TaxID=3708 RepID=UPI0020798652|nr:uncharacterized protein LOC106413574 [Brassica napus]
MPLTSKVRCLWSSLTLAPSSNALAMFQIYQRSRVTWLKVGDSSTSFYHWMMSLRKSANHIHFLLDDQDVKWENQEDINNLCVEYFSNLLGGEVLPKMFVQSDIDLLLPFRCSSTQASALERPFSAVEIKEAFFSLPHNKTCGPDGYSAEFFTGCWNIVGAEVISPSQSAFMPGRLLSENVLLATEIIQGYNRSNISPRGMLKVDLHKAFDSVRWDFILAALETLGIPEKFINWINQCLSTASFTLAINGCSSGFFKSSKGLRQGDPLSPYLFVLAMEVFTRLLTSRFENGSINYHPGTAELNISHLMFADDVMIFFDGTSNSLHGITETLDDFASWSGLYMNRHKTELFHAGLNQVKSTAIAAFGFPIGSLPIRYLGLPLMHRKLRISEYEPLLDSIVRKFRRWATKTLSYAGRLLLISTVISGSVNFWCSTFMLPKGCVKKIERLCSRFLWSGQIELAKGAKPNLTPILGPGKRSLISALIASRFIHGNLGNGRVLSFWFDSWLPTGPLVELFGEGGPSELGIPLNAKVADVSNVTSWDLPHARSEKALQLHIALTSVSPPRSTDTNDSYNWKVNGSICNGYSSSQTWEAIRPRESTKAWAPTVWFKGAVPKQAFNMWLTTLNRLPTKTRLASWGLNITTTCSLCNSADEAGDHLLLNCRFAVYLWAAVFARLSPRQPPFISWAELLSWCRVQSPSAPSTLRRLVTHVLVYHVWRQRNNFLHNNTHLSSAETFKLLDRDVRNTTTARRNKRNFNNLMALWIR